MAYNPNHHYNRRESSAGSLNSSLPLNSNTHSNNSVHNNGNIQQHGLSTPIEYTSRPSSASEYANPAAFNLHSAQQQQQQPTHRANVSNYYEDNPNRNSADIRTGTNPVGTHNPSLKFAPQNQNTSDSLYSLKQTLAQTLQNLHSNSFGTAYAPPENVFRSYQNRTDASMDPRQGDSGHSYHARPILSQSSYVHESPPESLFARNMQPPINLPNTHQGHLANRLSHNAPVEGYRLNNTFDTRISAAVAPVPGDVRYQASQQAHTAPQSGHKATLYNASVANRALSDRNSTTFVPTVVPRVAQSAQPQLAASAYYNRRPDSAHVNAPIQQTEGRHQNFDPRNHIVTGGQAHGYDLRLQSQAEPYISRGPSVARDNVTYDRVDHRDATPHTIYRNSADRNPPQYNNTSHPSSYTPHTSMNSHIIANPVATLPIRASKWSVKLVDPLDIYDKLLHNSLCIHEESTTTISANVTKSASVGPRATTRDDRNITTTNMNSANKYGYSVPSPTNMSRKRAISPVNSVASDRDRDRNYYGGSGDNRYSTGDRSTRPRVSDYSDIRRYDSNDSRNNRNISDRLDNRGTNRDRRSRSPSRSESVARSGEKSTSEHIFRPADRAVSRHTPAKDARERKSTAHDTTIATTYNHSLSTRDKPDYVSTTLSQLCTTFRTPSVMIQYTTDPTTLHAQDLYLKYPRLYVPNDFLRVTVDTQSMLDALSSGLVSKLVKSVPMLVESANPVLLSNPAVNNALVPPRCTMVDASSRNNALVVPTIAGVSSVNGVLSAHRSTTITNRFSMIELPVKFQVRVLVSCGVEDPLSIDPHTPFEEQLRILCGQRKSGLTLLGCPWHQDLDCGDRSSDTPLTNRSLLVKTVQRALFAQALLRIPVESTVKADTGTANYSSPGLVSLCEVNYLRPSEYVDGVKYEEQVFGKLWLEVTTIFLYALQPHLLQASLLTYSTHLFSDRVCRKSVGPTIHESVEMFDAKADKNATRSSITVEPTVGEGSKVGPVVSKTIGDSVVNTGNATVETVLASLVDAVVDTATADVSDSADLGTISENPREPPVIPSEPTVLLCPTPVSSEVLKDKKQSRDVTGLKLGTLAELITSYSQNDRTERVFEMALAAELTMSLLATDFANTVTDFVLASHHLLKRDVDERIVSAAKAVPVENASMEASESTTVINTTHQLDASAVVADVLNSIVNTVDGATMNTADVTADQSGMCEDSAEGCGFAIDTAPTVEKEIVVKSENDLQEDSAQKDPGVKTTTSEGDAHELKNRFLTAARWFDVRGEKCLHLEHLKMILHASTRLLSPGAVKDAVKRVCENDVFQYEAYVQ